ncbi:MAG: ATP-binding protein [Thermaurantimonas sp.]
MYSLDVDRKNCIVYCGGLEDFGFVELDDNNTFSYFSLINLLPGSQPSFGKIWQTIVLDHTYYISNKHIFEFDGSKISIHHAENNTFYKAFKLDRSLIVQEEGIGLFKIEDGKKIFIKKSDHFNDKLIDYILYDKYSLRIFFSDGVIAEAKLSENSITEIFFTNYEISKLIRRGRLNRIVKLYDGNYAFALENIGVAVTDQDLQIQYVYNHENNLINENVHDLFEDHFGNIWTAEDNIIRFINYGSPYSILNNNDGIKGIVNSFAELNNTLYFSDQFNIYTFSNYKISLVQRLDESIRKIYPIDETSFFVLTNKSIFIYKNQSLKRLIEISGGKNIFSIDKNSKLYGVFTTNQIWIFSLINNQIRIEYMKIIDQVELSDIVVDDDGRIWFSTVVSGVGFLVNDQFKFYDTKSGLPGYFNNRVVKINRQIYILSEDGILKPDKYLNSLRKTSDFGDYFKNVFVSNITETSLGYFIKISNKDNINEYYLINSDVTAHDDFNKLFRYLPERGFAGWYLSSDDKLYISFIENLYVLDLNKLHRLYQPLEITILNMFYNQKGYFDPKHKKVVLNYDYGPLKVIVTSPYYEGQDKIRYFYRIKEDINEWQEVVSGNEIIIPRLNFGDTELQIYARNVYGINSNIKSIPIRVKPPWYLSVYFIIFSIVFIGFLFSFYQKYRENLLLKRNKELEEIVHLRTLELLEEKKELERSKEELYQLSIQKNQLLGVYAHDLKNPLSAIDGIRELIDATLSMSDLDTATKNEVAEYLEMIKSSTGQMMAIIQDILSSVRQETFKQKIDKKITNIIDILSEHYALMNNYARQKNIQIHLLKPAGKYLVNVDERKIGEVFQNLISNAIKYSKENSEVTISVNCETKNGKEYVKVSIRDQGPGFTEDDKKKMFGLFQRLSAKPTKGESSTGLGLYIVKNYTELNDGFVELDSVYGEGSTFHIYLPIVEKVEAIM